MQMIGILDACESHFVGAGARQNMAATRSSLSSSHLDAGDQVLHAAAVAAGHAVNLVHDEHLLLRAAVEADGAVGHHLLHNVGALAV